jgi:hypothetical protein
MPRAHTQRDDARKNAGRRELACRLVDIGYELSEIADRAHGPSLDTLYEWLSEDGDFRARFEKARALRRERLAASIVALAADTAASPRDRKLAIEARKWCVALMDKEQSQNGSAEREAFDAEFIRRLEEGLKRADRMEREDAERKAKRGGDDRSQYEVTRGEAEPGPARP